jgi:hypothetical protein
MLQIPAETLLQSEVEHAKVTGGTRARDTIYDWWVTPGYPEYIDNQGVFEHIIEPQWDPKTYVILRWVSLSMGEVWKPTNRLRVICFNLLRLDDHSNVLGDLQAYVGGVQAQLYSMID